MAEGMSEKEGFKGNPYVHSEPITDSDYFVGREEEITRIRYELSQACAERPQFKNTGITGKEGAGKTSLSYVLEEIARDLGILTVRIRLNENIAHNEIQLFREILESISSTIGGNIYDNFVQKLRGVTESTDQVQLDFQFIRFYLSPGQDEEQSPENVSEKVVRRDLQEVYGEVDLPAIAVILDDAQHLGGSSLVLQKLKNIFTEIDGYILTLVGTDDTFPQIESAFSPVARTFEKFKVGPFESFEETKECIRRPLSDDDLISDETIWEIHRLTGGRPYEINLLAYHMYSYYDMNDYDRMVLSSEIITTVVEQMEEWRRSVDNEMPETIRRLNDRQVRILLSAVELPRRDIDRLARYSIIKEYYDTDGKIVSEFSEMKDSTRDLIHAGILTDDENNVEFRGDNYLTAYLKYYSLSENITDDFGGMVKEPDEGMISNIQYYIVDQTLLDGVDYYDSQYILTDLDKYDNSPRSVIAIPRDTTNVDYSDVEYSSHNHLVKDTNALSDRMIMINPNETEYTKSRVHPADPESEEYDDTPENITTLRMNVDWLGYGYIPVINCRGGSDQKTISENIKSKEDELGSMGIEILEENERTLADEAANLAQEGELEAALEKYERAIEINPEDPVLWINKARANRQENTEQALKDIERARELQEDWTDAYLEKGSIHFLMDEFEVGVAAFRKATELEPNNVNMILWISGNCGNFEQYEEEVEFAELAVEEEPKNIHARFHQTRGLYMTGRDEEVIEVANDVLDFEDYHEDSQIAKIIGFKGASLLRLSRPQESLNLFERLFEKWGAKGFKKQSYLFMGRSKFELGNYSEALDSLNDGLDTENTGGVVPNKLFRIEKLACYLNLEELEEAMDLIDNLDRSLSDSPETIYEEDEEDVDEDKKAYFYYLAAVAWAKKDNAKKAHRYLGKSIEIDDKYLEEAQETEEFKNLTSGPQETFMNRF